MKVSRSGLLASAVGWALLAGAAPSLAADASAARHPIKLDIAPQALDDALNEFAKQAGVQLVYHSKLAKGLQSPRIVGDLDPRDALNQLLGASGLRFEFLDDNTVAIFAPERSSSVGSGPAPSTDLRNGDGEIQEILVTGIRPYTEGNMDIVRTENDAQPYQIIGKAELERSGADTIETFLKKSLTMNTQARLDGQVSRNALAYRSNVNLRGVGANQTLILINGRRTATIANLGQTLQPDVQSIPIGAVERIEVLPVSSSAIYGGSAIGGVINVVLKRDVEGGQVDVSYRSPFDVSAPIRTVNATYGISLEEGRTHITVGARYSDATSPTSGDRRELYERGLRTVLRNNPALVSSPTSPYAGGTTPNIGSANGSNLVLRPEYGGTNLGSNITSVPVGTSSATSAADLAAGLLANAGRYNYAPVEAVGSYQGLGRRSAIHGEPEVKSFIANARRRMTDNVEAFVEFYTSKLDVSAGWAGYTGPYLVSAANPSNPFQQSVWVTLPPSVADERPMNVSNEIMRVTGGVIVDLPKDWQLESDYTWTRNKAVFGSFGLYFDTIPQGITSGAINPFLDTLANPVDLNYYGGNYLGTSPSQLDNVAVRVTGPLGHLPAGSPMLSLGLEYREESMRHASYVWNFANFPSVNLNRQYLPKSQQVLSAYAEMKIPLISKANRVPLVHELDLQLSARTERFDVKTGTTYIETPGAAVVDESVEYSSTNPTIGLRYKPIEQLMFRASYATGFLPPDYSQFLAPTLGGTDTRGPSATVNVIDPLRGNELVATQFISGGNPDIEPQESTSWSLGVVWTPPFVEGLRANLEWYRLELENVATRPTAQQIVTLANQFPNRVQRAAALPGDPYGVGRITLVDFSLLGANRLQTEGFDLSLDYQVPVLDWGTLRLSASGTLIRYFERQASIVSPLQDVTNQIAYDGPLERKGNFGIGWSKDAWKVDWTMSYFGSYEQYAVGGVTAYVQAQGSRTIPSQSYHDVVFTYGWDEDAGSALLSGVTLQLGVNNVFDKVPPLDVFYSSSSYYSPFGDPRLREYRLSLSKRF